MGYNFEDFGSLFLDDNRVAFLGLPDGFCWVRHYLFFRSLDEKSGGNVIFLL
jgi:hypothetical protein